MEKPNITPWICPRCGEETTSFPALSRRDNKTKICSRCGTEEAMIDLFLSEGKGE